MLWSCRAADSERSVSAGGLKQTAIQTNSHAVTCTQYTWQVLLSSCDDALAPASAGHAASTICQVGNSQRLCKPGVTPMLCQAAKFMAYFVPFSQHGTVIDDKLTELTAPT